MHAKTHVSKFEYLITLYCNVQNNYFLFARKNEKEEEEKNNRVNAIFDTILLFIENDGHMTNHVTNLSTPRYFISCCYIKKQEILGKVLRKRLRNKYFISASLPCRGLICHFLTCA